MPVHESDSGGGDPTEFPAKGTGRPPGPGGGPGGPPGGGFVGFAGVRPQVFRGLTGFGSEGIPIVMRRRGLSQIPGVTPGPPGRSDSVPAMLSPGEVVMNNGVTQNPQALMQLLQMNQQGAQDMGFEAGGIVPEGGDEQEMPGQRPSRALRILQLLLELDDEGGEPEGFAFGGIAGLGRMGSLWGRRGGSRGANQPAGGTAAPQSPGGFQYEYNPNNEGAATGFNPADPYGGYAANRNAFGSGMLYRGVGQAGQAGYFDPRGNQMLIRSMQEGAQGDADALVRRQMTQANLSGLDPAQAAVAKQQALRETGRGVQDIMANTRAGALGNMNDFYQNQYNQLAGASLDYGRNEQLGRNQRMAQNNEGRNSGGFWGRLGGNVLGNVAGSWLGRH